VHHGQMARAMAPWGARSSLKKFLAIARERARSRPAERTHVLIRQDDRVFHHRRVAQRGGDGARCQEQEDDGRWGLETYGTRPIAKNLFRPPKSYLLGRKLVMHSRFRPLRTTTGGMASARVHDRDCAPAARSIDPSLFP
jgi:hypothetical protein